MANFSGFTFPGPHPSSYSYAVSIAGFTQFTPNSTSGTANIQFPSPPVSTAMVLNGRPRQEGILTSATDKRPTATYRLAGKWQSTVSPSFPWVGKSDGITYGCTASHTNRTSPIASTSGWPNSDHRNKSKRKAVDMDMLTSDEPENKIFVNEERMAECMQQLHLDNNNLNWHPDLEQQQPWQHSEQDESWYSRSSSSTNNNDANYESQQTSHSSNSSADDYDEDRVACSRHRRSKSCPKLEISQELELTLQTKHLLSQVILDELKKPCMQVVLWKPPGDVRDIISGMTATGVNEVNKETLLVEASDSIVSPNVWSVPAEVESKPSTDEGEGSDINAMDL